MASCVSAVCPPPPSAPRPVTAPPMGQREPMRPPLPDPNPDSLAALSSAAPPTTPRYPGLAACSRTTPLCFYPAPDDTYSSSSSAAPPSASPTATPRYPAPTSPVTTGSNDLEYQLQIKRYRRAPRCESCGNCFSNKDTRSMVYVMLQLGCRLCGRIDQHMPGACPTNPSNRSYQKMKKHKLIAPLNDPYDTVNVKWMIERGAVCRWVVICNRCRIEVCQECNGVRGKQVFASCVCRACEKTEQKRESCLCPARGGSLKPTDVDTHVTCAWFNPQVAFAGDDPMEPAAIGIFNIQPLLHMKMCVTCRQIHDSCTQCYKCSTHYCDTCASRAGYEPELHFFEENVKQMIKKISCCAQDRSPNLDSVLITQTHGGTLSSKNLDLSNGKVAALRQVKKDLILDLDSPSKDEILENLSTARCLVNVKKDLKRSREGAIGGHLRGPPQHHWNEIDDLNPPRVYICVNDLKIPVDIDLNSTVGEFVRDALLRKNIKLHDMYFVLNGRILDPDLLLAYAPICSGSRIHVTLRLRGGMPVEMQVIFESLDEVIQRKNAQDFTYSVQLPSDHTVENTNSDRSSAA